MVNRGILLVQPEHILSFKLMGIDCVSRNMRLYIVLNGAAIRTGSFGAI